MGINLSQVSLAYSKNKKYGYKFAIKDVNLNINNRDEFIAVVGHTGSGKSTLVQTLNALLVPTFGHVCVEFREKEKDIFYNILANGKKVKYSLTDNNNPKYQNKVTLKPLRCHIGLVFQFPEYQIFEETVLKDIMFGPKNFLSSEKEAEDEARRIAEMMKITNLLDKSPFSLSGGQMRKVAIAGILASNPDVLVLDEPTVGLDPLAKKELLEFLKYVNETEHKSIIIITHDMDVVGEYAKRVLLLDKGNVEFDGDKDTLFRNEEIVKSHNIDFPNTVNILRELNNKLDMNFDIYKYNVKDVFEEIQSKLGEKHE